MKDREIDLTELNGYRGGSSFHASAKLARGFQQSDSVWFDKESPVKLKFATTNLDLALLEPFLPEGYRVAAFAILISISPVS